MISRLFPILLSLCLCISAQAQKNKYVTGNIIDQSTRELLMAKVELLRASDSVVIAQTNCNLYSTKRSNNQSKYYARFSLKFTENGNYILRCSASRHKTLFYPVVANIKGRQADLDVGTLAMEPDDGMPNVMLDNVDVVATKVKFYFDKDTLIYNADAFKMQNGAVLEELLSKMPGLRINGNTIYSNGQAVHALLLNGKDFFNNDRHTILKNLPTFMVKSVKVYEKTPDSVSFIRRERELKGLVMDVRLKKEYEHFFAGNFDIGQGTDKRYRYKLFGLRFSQVSRLSATVTANNVNGIYDRINESQNSNSWIGSGEHVTDALELRYNLDHPRGLYELSGELNARYSDKYEWTKTSSQTYYTNGDVFNRSDNRRNSYNFELSTSHDMEFFGNTVWNFSVSPRIRFSRANGNEQTASANFNTDVNDMLGESWVDSLLSPELTHTLELYGITRTKHQNRNDGQNTNISVNVSKTYKPRNTNDELFFNFNGRFDERKGHSYNQRTIDYIADKNKGSDFNNHYSDNYSKTNRYDVTTSYLYKLDHCSSLTASYKYGYNSDKDNRSLFLLHLLDDWKAGTSHPLGELPSILELYSTLDPNNSHLYHNRKSDNTFTLSYDYELKREEKAEYHFNLSVPLKHSNERLRYENSMMDTLATRHKFVPEVLTTFNFRSGHQRSLELSYHYQENLPSMLWMINITDDSNPLSISENNPDLKRTSLHSFVTSFTWRPNKPDMRINVRLSYDLQCNDVAYFRQYDKTTGVRHSKPMNINGNDMFRAGADLTRYFYRGNITHAFYYDFLMYWTNRADYSMEASEEAAVKRLVHNYLLGQGIDYKLSVNRLTLSSKVYFEYQRSSSASANFQRVNAFNLKYGLEADYKIGQWAFKSSINNVSGWGYAYSEMNKTTSLWNMSVRRNLQKVSLELEAYDILNQNRDVFFAAYGSSRYERITNILRRYVMLHFIYRFNTKKKDK